MRAVVSTIGSPAYDISKYLEKILQSSLNKNKHRVINTSSFVEEVNEWNISPNKKKTFDAVNIKPSVPIDGPVAVIIEILNNDSDDLQKRTKLTLTDIHKLIKLCLCPNHFTFDNQVHILENSGLIGLPLMTVIWQELLQRLEDKATHEALTTKLALLRYGRYANDSHTRFETVFQFHSFLNMLNKQNKVIQ